MIEHEYYWCDEEFIRHAQPVISALDRGFLLADGLFETIKVTNKKPLFLPQHWQRLKTSADFLEIKLTISFEHIEKIIADLLTVNKLDNAGLRVTLTRGSGPRGLIGEHCHQPTLVIQSFPLMTDRQKIINLHIATYKRNLSSPLSMLKSLNYLNHILAQKEAVKAGYDEALLLNTAGNLAETVTANIFLVKNNTLYTPRINDGALPGIIRAKIIALCKQQSIPCHQQALTPHDLACADEVFITNALRHIVPASEQQIMISQLQLLLSEALI